MLPDSIHLRCSLSGETGTFHFEYIFYRPQVAYCAVQTTQFFTFYAGTAGGPQLRFAEISEDSSKNDNISARDEFKLSLFSISGSPLGDVTTSIRKCWR